MLTVKGPKMDADRHIAKLEREIDALKTALQAIKTHADSEIHDNKLRGAWGSTMYPEISKIALDALRK